jgi:hypothetical protein
MTITIHADTGTRIVFERNGKIYTAVTYDPAGEAPIRTVRTITTSNERGFRTFSRDRCPDLYGDIEAAI